MKTHGLWVGLMLLPSLLSAQPSPPMPIHAHNDYRNEKPLHGALSHAVASVEVDIYRVGGRLLVAHDREELPTAPELQAMYLEPLKIWFDRQDGCGVYHREPLTLLVDFKSEADSTYTLLLPMLEEYADLFTRYENGAVENGCVTVVISGSRPVGRILSAESRRAFLDGRFSDDPALRTPSVAPMVSGSWMSDFKWMGGGVQPDAERSLLMKRVAEAHSHGQKIRFWASPDNEAMWQTLLQARVDYINTDRVANLAQWLNQASKE